MASTTVSAGDSTQDPAKVILAKGQIRESIALLSGWLEKNDYRGYDTFDGLNARFARRKAEDRKSTRLNSSH